MYTTKDMDGVGEMTIGTQLKCMLEFYLTLFAVRVAGCSGFDATELMLGAELPLGGEPRNSSMYWQMHFFGRDADGMHTRNTLAASAASCGGQYGNLAA